MVVFGTGAIVAGRVVGHVLTRKPVDLVLRTVLVLMAVLLSIVSALTAAHINRIAAVAAFPLLFCLGIVWCTGGVAQQTRIAAHAPLHRSQALGVHFSVQFLGVSVGGALGGLALSLGGPMTVPLVSALIAAASLLSIRLTTPTLVDV
jgi:predicted MFS family arabinose efflux permease